MQPQDPFVTTPYAIWRPSFFKSEVPAEDSGLQIVAPSPAFSTLYHLSEEDDEMLWEGVQWGCYQSARQRRTVYPISKTSRTLLRSPLKISPRR